MLDNRRQATRFTYALTMSAEQSRLGQSVDPARALEAPGPGASSAIGRLGEFGRLPRPHYALIMVREGP